MITISNESRMKKKLNEHPLFFLSKKDQLDDVFHITELMHSAFLSHPPLLVCTDLKHLHN